MVLNRNLHKECYYSFMKTYTGGCHCGHVKFEAQIDLENEKVIECDCSHCYKKGFVLSFIPASSFKLMLDGEVADVLSEELSGLTEYLFNKKWIHHMFCSTCGVQAYGHALEPKSGEQTVAVNLRCVDDLDFSTLSITKFNGKDL